MSPRDVEGSGTIVMAGVVVSLGQELAGSGGDERQKDIGPNRGQQGERVRSTCARSERAARSTVRHSGLSTVLVSQPPPAAPSTGLLSTLTSSRIPCACHARHLPPAECCLLLLLPVRRHARPTEPALLPMPTLRLLEPLRCEGGNRIGRACNA